MEADGRKWVTREPSICYFHSDYWFNVISMIREDGIYHYCNLGTPFAVDEQALKYIDYDLDIKVFPDGRFHLLDEGEYEQHRRQMKYPDSIDRILDIMWMCKPLDLDKKGPFSLTTLTFGMKSTKNTVKKTSFGVYLQLVFCLFFINININLVFFRVSEFKTMN